MGVISRPPSPYLWIWVPGQPAGKGTNPINTKIRIGITRTEQKANLLLAEQALAVAVLKHAKLANGLPLEPEPAPAPEPPLLFAALAATYQTQHLPKQRGAYREQQILPRLIAAFGDLPVTAPAKDWVARTTAWREVRLTTPVTVAHYGGPQGKPHTFPRPSPRTVNREVGLLQQVLQTAVDAKLIAQSPLWGFHDLPCDPVQRRLTSHDEEVRLLAQLAPDDKAIYLLARDGLVRLGDVLEARRDDDHGTTFYFPWTKNGDPVTIPVTARLRAALDAVPIDPDHPAWYFPRRRKAAKADHRSRIFAKVIARACRDATPPIPYGKKQRGLTFHWATRTTGSTRMIRTGGDGVIADVARIGGWRDTSVLMETYQQTVTEDMQRIAELASAPPITAPKPPTTRRSALRMVKKS